MKRSYLHRKTPLQRGKPLRRTKLKPVSEKRKKESVVYAQKVRAYQIEHPFCEVCSIINTVAPVACEQRVQDNHHMMGRGKYYLDERFFRSACRPGHQWIEDHKNTAREMGLILYR